MLCRFNSYLYYKIDLWCNGNTTVFGAVIIGSSPVKSTNKSGSVAQMVEQWTENPCVPGSNPGISTNGAII